MFLLAAAQGCQAPAEDRVLQEQIAATFEKLSTLIFLAQALAAVEEVGALPVVPQIPPNTALIFQEEPKIRQKQRVNLHGLKRSLAKPENPTGKKSAIVIATTGRRC